MSASREKRNRKDPIIVPFENESAPQKSGSGLKKVLAIIGTVLAVIVAAFCIMASTGFFAKHSTAVTVGEHKVSPVEYNYFYREVYYELAQSYGENSNILSYMTDYVKTQTLDRIKTAYAVYDAALADGCTLSEEDAAALEQELAELDTTATGYGMSNGNALLVGMYGQGSSKSSYKAYREMTYIVSRYSQDQSDAFNITDSDVNTYYNEHRNDFDTVTYRQFMVPAGETRSVADAQTIADEMVALLADGNTAAFADKCREFAPADNADYYEDDEASLLTDVTISSTGEEVAGWLSDNARAEGDTTTIAAADDAGIYVLGFLSRDTLDYDTVNVRHILIGFGEDKAAAYETAKAHLDEFLNGDKTEDSFAALATEYSEDNAENGGLYENIHKGQMVPEFNDWIFGDRQVGDCEIVETEYGYHIIYFCGNGENYRNNAVKTTLQNDRYTEWTNELTAGYAAEEQPFGMRFVTTTIAQQ